MTDATDVALEKACEAFRAVMFGSSPIAANGFDPCIKAAIEAYQAALPKGELAERLLEAEAELRDGPYSSDLIKTVRQLMRAAAMALEAAYVSVDYPADVWQRRQLVERAILAYLTALPADGLAGRVNEAAGVLDSIVHKSLAADLRAAASLLGGGVPEGWQPIETAPKDGTRILLAKIVGHLDHPTALWWAIVGMWSEKWNNWNDGIEPCGLAGPTHWMPISAHGVGIAARPPESGRE